MAHGARLELLSRSPLVEWERTPVPLGSAPDVSEAVWVCTCLLPQSCEQGAASNSLLGLALNSAGVAVVFHASALPSIADGALRIVGTCTLPFEKEQTHLLCAAPLSLAGARVSSSAGQDEALGLLAGVASDGSGCVWQLCGGDAVALRATRLQSICSPLASPPMHASIAVSGGLRSLLAVSAQAPAGQLSLRILERESQPDAYTLEWQTTLEGDGPRKAEGGGGVELGDGLCGSGGGCAWLPWRGGLDALAVCCRTNILLCVQPRSDYLLSVRSPWRVAVSVPLPGAGALPCVVAAVGDNGALIAASGARLLFFPGFVLWQATSRDGTTAPEANLKAKGADPAACAPEACAALLLWHPTVLGHWIGSGDIARVETALRH
eukprot:6182731-Pleurochrysis_carterae.AAC.1